MLAHSIPEDGRRRDWAWGMRKYPRALFLFVALCAAPAASADLPTAKPPPEPVVTPPLPSHGVSRSPAMDGRRTWSANRGVGPFPTQPFSANFLKILEHFEGGLMRAAVARNDMFIGGLDLIWSARGGTQFRRADELALSATHANLTLTEVDRHRLRRVKDTGRTAQSATLRHGRALVISTFTRRRLIISRPRIRLHVHAPKQRLGRSGRRTGRPLPDQRQMVRQRAHRYGRPQTTARPAKRSVRLDTIGRRRSATTLGYRVLYTYERDISGPLPRFPLSVLDVRAFRRFQVQLLGELFCAASTAVGSSLTTPRTRASRAREMRRAGARR